MHLENIFYLLGQLELETGKLYSSISSRISATRPELAAFFDQLAAEEQQHFTKVRMIRELFIEADRAKDDISTLETKKTERGFDLDAAEVKALDNHLAFIKSRQDLARSPDLDLRPSKLLAMALDIELQMKESHYLKYFHIQDERIRELIDSLCRGDEEHIRMIRDYQG